MKRFFFLLITSLCFTLASAQNVQLATFNIRYMNGDKGTVHCWENRRDSLIRFLKTQNLSIIGMQEVLSPQMADLIAALPGYDYVGVGREDGREKGEFAPIFYDKKIWKAKKKGVFWLSETPEVAGSMGWDAACTRLATWVLLWHRKSGRKVVIINTHFDHVGHTARIESAKLIMQRAKEISSKAPLVLTGDFNVSAEDSVYTTITTSTDCPLRDTYQAECFHQGVRYTFHDFGRIPADKCSKIDFVFASPNIQPLSVCITAEQRQGTQPFYMSDHNPVLVKLLLP